MIEEILINYAPVLASVGGIITAVIVFIKELNKFILGIKDTLEGFKSKIDKNTELTEQVKIVINENYELKKELKELTKTITKINKE